MPNYYRPNQGILAENLEALTGINEVLITNINACKDLKNLVSSSYGPYGERKLIIQKNQKILITSDSSVILNNLDFTHPASKLILTSVFFQEQELGDSSGFVIIFTAELLDQALKLLNMGFHSIEIIKTFQKAENVCLNLLYMFSNHKLKNLEVLKSIVSILQSLVGFKCENLTKNLIPQISYACVKISSNKNQKFTPENIRVVKILGGGVCNTRTIPGTLVLRDSEGTVKIKKNARIAIYSCFFDFLSPETKNKVQFSSPGEILSYESKEYNIMEKRIQNFLSKEINVIIASGFNEDMLKILDDNNIMAIKIQSKFEIQRIALVTNSTVMPKLGIPELSAIGYADKVSTRSFGFQKVTIFYQQSIQNNIFTIVARANCNSILDLIERFVYKTSSIFKTIVRDNRFIPGAGACEIEISRRLKSFSQNLTSSSEKFIFKKFAESFEIFPEILIQNSKLKGSKLLSHLYNQHEKGIETAGLDLENFKVICSKKFGVWDLFSSKFWAIKNSIDSALTILSIDQIIISKDAHQN